MNKVLKTIGFIAFVAVIGFSIAGCKDDAPTVPGTLAADATYQQALDKCDEIMAYCDANDAGSNSEIRSSVSLVKSTIKSGGEAGWSSIRSSMVQSINQCIAALK